MGPDIHPNYWAILVAVAATMVLGFLWYGPIFGKAWMKEMGIPAGSKPDPKVMRRGLILMLIGSFLTAFVLAYTGEVWRPSVWKAGADRSAAFYGFLRLFHRLLDLDRLLRAAPSRRRRLGKQVLEAVRHQRRLLFRHASAGGDDPRVLALKAPAATAG